LGNYTLDGTNQGFCIFFFYLGVPARRQEIVLHSRTPSNAAAPSGFPFQ
jgi:hypothetical protein